MFQALWRIYTPQPPHLSERLPLGKRCKGSIYFHFHKIFHWKSFVVHSNTKYNIKPDRLRGASRFSLHSVMTSCLEGGGRKEFFSKGSIRSFGPKFCEMFPREKMQVYMLLAFCLRNKKVLGKKLESLRQKFFLVSQPIFAQIRDQRSRHIYKTIWLW